MSLFGVIVVVAFIDTKRSRLTYESYCPTNTYMYKKQVNGKNHQDPFDID